MNGHSSTGENNNVEEASLTSKIKELELELAQTKLALVEAECRNEVGAKKTTISP